MTSSLDLPLHLWQSISQGLIYSHPKPKDFRTSLPQFRDILRLRATCSEFRDIIDQCYLLFALSKSSSGQYDAEFESSLSFIRGSNWRFYWLGLDLFSRKTDMMPFVGYEKLFAHTLRVLRIENWHVSNSEDFNSLDDATLPLCEPLCNYRTRIEINLIKNGEIFKVPEFVSAHMVTYLHVYKYTSLGNLTPLVQQLALTFRLTLLSTIGKLLRLWISALEQGCVSPTLMGKINGVVNGVIWRGNFPRYVVARVEVPTLRISNIR